MSVVQCDTDFGGDLVKGQSDDLALRFWFCGAYNLRHCAVLRGVEVFIRGELLGIGAGALG